MHQKYYQDISDPEKKDSAMAEYTLWKYDYPNNVTKEQEERMRERFKRRRMQAQKDALNAELHAKDELSRIDESVSHIIEAVKKEYTPIKDGSEFISLLNKYIDSGASILRSSPEQTFEINYEYLHLFSIKCEDIIKDEQLKRRFAYLLCCIDTIKDSGIVVNRRIVSKNDELYISFEISLNDYYYFYPSESL